MNQESKGRTEVPQRVLRILRCLECRSELKSSETELACAACGRRYPVLQDVPRFVDAQEYAGSFGFQWKTYSRTQLDSENSHESEEGFRAKTKFTPEELCGKLVLDVGCGMGRFAEVASRWGGEVVGIDLSLAAEVARKNLAERPNVTILQADVFKLPFAEKSFDYIYSLGVLHHTPDCRKAFLELPKYLKPGGKIAVWLYDGYNKEFRCSDFYRRVTHRMPSRLLLAMCHIAVPIYYVHKVLRKIPLIGRPMSALLHFMLPTSLHPKAEWRILDTFDWYSPRYQSRHTYEEVYGWFQEAGLENIQLHPDRVAMQGARPSAASQIEARVQECVASQA